MSMAIQRSKYTGDRMNYQGDPGLFGFLGSVAKTGLGLAAMLPGVGGIARTISGAIFPPAPGTTTYAQPGSLTRMPSTPMAGPGGIGGGLAAECRAVGVPDWRKCGDLRAMGREVPGFFPGIKGPVPAPGILPAIQRFLPGGETGMMPAEVNGMMAGRPAVSGYHWNKSGYFLKSGEYVYPGSKMVKNRRRNPANPRATSNAITRIKGAKRYAASLSSISIRKKC